ncbi:MAG: hypothetical protein KIT84_32585 [Labilithrix sp.]|nr:hypothetical protein [Labilithrix sp.]MCW5815812.1 hypothetical protein [Labilithrix sp.]
MPELPEVEHTRRNLVRWMKGARIAEVTATDARIAKPSPRAFVKALTGRVVTAIDRKGKWLRLLLDDGTRVFGHLGMTGWFEQAGPEPLRFERVGFVLAKKKKRVAYVDSRRWGRLEIARADVAGWTALGPDPLADGIDRALLATKLARRKKTSVKEALMDQKVLAGVGNIQAIEALWKAKIDPRSRAGAMTAKDVAAIAEALKWTIARTLADLAKGDAGAENPFVIYGRKGTPCRRCKTLLVRADLGGRTTTWCPGCQALKR